MTATSTKKMTAFACPTPRLRDAGVEGVDDVQRQHFGGLNDLAALLDKGSAGSQRQVLVVQLKGVGQA